MAWNEAVITTTGMDLLAKCLTEGNIVITRAVGGESCSAALSLLTLNSIKEPCHEMNLFRIENEGGKIVVNLRVQNKGLEEEYTLRQIGLFAKLEAEDSDVLFAVIQDSIGEVIPSESENPEFLVEFDFVIPVSNTENIDVAVTPNTFATADDILKQEKALEAHTSDKANPHAVTKAQVGLGNVPNVATNDQTPTYTEANTLTELSSDEKLSVAFGKLAKAVKTLISHIADNVKHITAAERTAWNGKAAGDHTHSAATQSAAGLMSANDKKKLDGVAASANNYSLPAASSTARGGVKIGYTANGRNYPVQLSNEQMYVNVPWTDNNTTYSNMTAATASAAGKAGLVPAPAAGSQGKYLRGDGTWQTPPTNTGPKGDKGDTGATGAAAGFGTPTATVDANVGTPTVTVTASGSNTAKVFNFAFKNLKGVKGDKGDKGATGAQGAAGAKGATGTRGSRWTAGTAITGASTIPTVFSGSGITDALVNDMYLNTSTGCVYRCTTAGTAAAAKWVCAGSIKGATGAKGDKGATGATGATGAKGDKGDKGDRGSKWFAGNLKLKNAIGGFQLDYNGMSSDTHYKVGDMYLHSSTKKILSCITEGVDGNAIWKEICTL